MSEPAKRKRGKKRPKGRSGRLTVRRVPGADVFELVHPPCARARSEDMEEVHAMLEAGEVDVAVDELRWLIERCSALLEAHKLLGEIAWDDGNVPLARAHFGYAYQLGLDALPKEGFSGPLPYARPANRDFFETGKKLALCLERLGKPELAQEVADRLVALDPTDPPELSALRRRTNG